MIKSFRKRSIGWTVVGLALVVAMSGCALTNGKAAIDSNASAPPATAATGNKDAQNGSAVDKPSADGSTSSALLDSWLRLWNGDFTQAPGIISPDFTVHAALMDGGDGSSIHGVDGLEGMIHQLRAAFTDLHFSMQVTLIDGHKASARWTATGTYAGGFPGATAEPGTIVTFTGTDTLRIKDGKFVEYWFNTDELQLLTQLGAH